MHPETAIENLVSVLRLKHLANDTEQSYKSWLRRYMRFISDRAATGTTEAKIESFLTQLARQDVAASTQNQAFNAILFFYKHVLKQEIGKVDSLRAKKPVHLRYAPEQAMGHSNLETTMGYLHAEAMSVRSPLEVAA